MKDMKFGYCDTNYRRSKDENIFDLVIFSTTTNQEYIEKAKSTETYLEFYENGFYIMTPYNTKTKNINTSNTELYYVTYEGDLKLIDKIKNKEDLKEIKEYLKPRLPELV
jgi:predicted nucleotidyltransferase